MQLLRCHVCNKEFYDHGKLKQCSELCHFAYNIEKAPTDMNDCWLWISGTMPFGYGWSKYKGIGLTAHRRSFKLFNGDLDERFILHSCDNPPCINPFHLRQGTSQDNIDDMVKRNRLPNRKGENGGRAILTETNVRNIRASMESNAALGLKYDVHEATIKSARIGLSWPHLKS